MNPTERLADLLPALVGDLAARHHATNGAPPMPSNVDLLNRAADLIEEFAKDTTPGSWNGFLSTDGPGFGAVYGGPFENGYRTGDVMGWSEETVTEYGGEPSAEDLRWLCLMSPHIAVPLVTWLRSAARTIDATNPNACPSAVAFARAVLDESEPEAAAA